jgi:hypothetical protein
MKMEDLKVKLLSKLIDELNDIPELESKMGEGQDAPGLEDAEMEPKGAAVKMLEVSELGNKGEPSEDGEEGEESKEQDSALDAIKKKMMKV